MLLDKATAFEKRKGAIAAVVVSSSTPSSETELRLAAEFSNPFSAVVASGKSDHWLVNLQHGIARRQISRI